MKKKVYLWLLAMCVTAGTATPVYAVGPVAEQSTVEENTGNVEENQEQEKAPENNGENAGEENSGEGKDTENSGENADEEEKSGEVAEVPEDELALQELGEENQIAAFFDEETLTVTDLTELISALNNENCKKNCGERLFRCDTKTHREQRVNHIWGNIWGNTQPGRQRHQLILCGK